MGEREREGDGRDRLGFYSNILLLSDPIEFDMYDPLIRKSLERFELTNNMRIDVRKRQWDRTQDRQRENRKSIFCMSSLNSSSNDDEYE